MDTAIVKFARDRSAGSAGRTTRIVLAAAFLSVAGLAGGCASYEQDGMVVGTVPDDYRTRFPIVVSQSERSEDIAVAVNASKIPYRDRAIVENFANDFKRSGVRSMAILIPSGSPNEAAARRIAHQSVRILGKEGVPAGKIRIQHYTAVDHGDAATVRFVYGDLTAHVPSKCGQWPSDLLEDSQNRNYDNFGCATQHNLAAIVANPADLLGPRGESSIDASRRTTVIEDWRENGTGNLPILF